MINKEYIVCASWLYDVGILLFLFIYCYQNCVGNLLWQIQQNFHKVIIVGPNESIALKRACNINDVWRFFLVGYNFISPKFYYIKAHLKWETFGF